MKKNRKIALMLMPSLTVTSILFLGGIVLSVMESLNYMPIIGEYNWNLDTYKEVIGSDYFLPSLGFTFYISIMATVISVALAVITALAMSRAFKNKNIITFLYQIPLPVPHLISGVSFMLLLAQSGLIARACHHLNIISEPSEFPILTFDTYAVGLILSLVWKFTPFIGIAVISTLNSFGNDYKNVAILLGANRLQIFRHVFLPVIMPSIKPSAIIIFAYAFSSYEIPLLLGGIYPKTLAVVSYQYLTGISIETRSDAMAISVIMTSIIFLVFILISNVNHVRGKFK